MENEIDTANLQNNKIPTGVAGLDSLFSGGIKPGASILLYGEPMCGKKILAMQFIYEGLRSQIPAIYLLTDFGYTEFKSKMHSNGWDLINFERNGMLQVIDCFSKQFEPSLTDSGVISYAEGSSELSNISLLTAKIQDQITQDFSNHRLVINSLSSLLKENDEQTFYRYIQFMVAKFRRVGATAMFTLEKGMHDEKKVKMIEHFMDYILEFEDGKLRLNGLRIKDKKWHEYKITPNGLKIDI